MAGDWIKIEENMPDKPEVCRMAARLGIECDAVAGKLLRVWAWASRNCNADGVTSVTVKSYLDRLTAVTGFADAMVESGWLMVDGENLMFPNFDRHCSQTAKDRANTNRRVARHREYGNAASVTNVTPDALQKPLPEKRREDSNTPIVPKGTKAKDPLRLRAEAIFKRRADTPLTAGEERAFAKSKAAIAATAEADWQLLESFYAAPQSETFTRKDLATLVNNWNGEIDRARAWQSKRRNHNEPAITLIPA